MRITLGKPEKFKECHFTEPVSWLQVANKSAVYLHISRHCGKVKEVSDSSIGKSIMSENSMGGWPQLPGAQGNGPGPGEGGEGFMIRLESLTVA